MTWEVGDNARMTVVLSWCQAIKVIAVVPKGQTP